MRKKILYILLIIFAANIYFLITIIVQKPLKDKLRVIFFDVGQGDASLIMAEGGVNILIDGGPNRIILENLDKYLPIYNKKLDIVVLTHPHSDHIAGLIDVLEKYEVKEVWMTGVLHSSYEYLSFLELIRNKKIKVKIIPDKGNPVYDIAANAQIEVLYPVKHLNQQKADNLNNTSIVLKVNYKDKSFLFAGDIEKEAENDLLEKKINLKSNILKIAHHGSDTSSGDKFLEAVKPEIAIIPVGKNDFSFPSLRVVRRLERKEIKVYRTDENGDMVFEADGISIHILR